ncbi:MAG: cob(I)yrinic acid a,c-diamide adenosyltransferase [Dehalococcoidales bacterium]|nr:cob(I)yrinic acid a,c-diamide adenosyltransferase [Dehalococcoidales bacterium]
MKTDSNPLGRGYVQIYTGNGKGKTTAALGLAFRAMGCGLKTYIGQFLKGRHYSELDAAMRVSDYITIEQFGKPCFVHVKPSPDREDIEMAKNALAKTRAAMLSGEYNIVIFDEILTGYLFHLVTIEEMLQVIRDKPEGVEIVFTGRGAPPEIIAAADLVSEVKDIKHYYEEGVPAREGIEC